MGYFMENPNLRWMKTRGVYQVLSLRFNFILDIYNLTLMVRVVYNYRTTDLEAALTAEFPLAQLGRLTQGV